MGQDKTKWKQTNAITASMNGYQELIIQNNALAVRAITGIELKPK